MIKGARIIMPVVYDVLYQVCTSLYDQVVTNGL